MKQTAGTLLYKQSINGLEVLLVHSSGNYNRNSPWSIPKGEIEAGESQEDAARRETLEETGIKADVLVPLGSTQYQKSQKQIHCFAGPAPSGATPSCASDEIDRAEFMLLIHARLRIHPDQLILLERLEKLLKHRI